jgi:4-hydroxy-tetrahydrodipicolinate synthase
MIVPIVTPLNTQSQPDLPALRRICDVQIQAGIEVIFVLGTTGEFYGLDQQQQRVVVETVLEAVAGRVAVIAGISGHSTLASLQALREYQQLGLAAYVSSTPYFMSYSQGELLDHFRILADTAHAPLILYNYPGRYRHRIEISSIRQLLEEKRVLGIKDTEGDFEYMQQLLELRKAFPSFRVFEGALPNLARSGRLGLDGSVQALANLLPDECAALWQHINGQRWQLLETEVARMWTFHQELESVASFIRAMKGCMAMRQWCSAVPAPPMRSLGLQSLQRLRELMDRTYPNRVHDSD